MADKIVMTQEIVGEIWQAFTTLSDAQDLLMEFGDSKRSHEEMNHAKRHLHQVLTALPDEVRRDAMLVMNCSLKTGVDVE